MISFFRKIRQKLLSQNRVTRYLVYALGEIILVVLGILIALQINNWNEQNKNRIFEKEILSLINENLSRDSILLTEEYQKAVLANQITDSILNRVNQGIFDETLNLWMGKVIRFERFKSQSSGFEVLKSKGIDHLSVQKLKVDLINYYDEILFKVYQSNSDVEGSFNEDWIPLAKKEFSDFDYDDRMEPIDLKAFMENPQHIVLFKMFQDNREGAIYRMSVALEEISSLKAQIKSHLE